MSNPSDRHDIMPLLSSAEVGFIRLRPTYERPNLGKPKFGCESGDPYSRGGGYGSPLSRGRQLSEPIKRIAHHTSNAGISIQRRSFQLLSPASVSCTPLAPSRSVHLNGAPS